MDKKVGLTLLMINIIRSRKNLVLFLLLFIVFLAINTKYIWQIMYPIKYDEIIYDTSQKYDIDPFLLMSIIQVETRFNEDKVSKKGAIGPMQIMPETATWIINTGGFHVSYEDLKKPRINLELGSWYISNIYYQLDKNLTATIAAYNAGPTKVARWINEGVWDGTTEHIDQIPIGETRHYIQRVLFFYDRYSWIYEFKYKAIKTDGYEPSHFKE